ncbi:GntR family transcriptional regulator [Nocardioides panacisoli]|uniref:GntR family transcriptional regulator n=1 Tax=Nocardioides panacisoli TaxID=627624 RepID=UPI001C6397A6|nr:GntR family transcriptional regulator [Nocardioides panacisoli]QYJ05094.1 GntR family transcriptional regulator [Nocardioides panacisoli]
MATTSAWLDALTQERPAIGRSSTADRVADVLRTQITEGALRPRTRLSEAQIGEALGVSRNTLREAFRLLGYERLVVHEFNRGVFVRSLTAADVRDLYAFRRVVEVGAVAQYDVERADLSDVRRAVEDGDRAARDGEWVRLGTADIHFHRAIAALGGSARVDEAMGQVLAELRLVFGVMVDPRAFHEPYLPQNREILGLLAAGERGAAGDALVGYLDRAERQLLDAFDEGGRGR